MLIIHVIIICPNCGQERERFSDEEDGTLITCPQCGITYEMGKAEEIQAEW
jgi:predicted RNA-binding Zn-ribbon protein involved in translation (DUF1610 family)